MTLIETTKKVHSIEQTFHDGVRGSSWPLAGPRTLFPRGETRSCSPLKGPAGVVRVIHHGPQHAHVVPTATCTQPWIFTLILIIRRSCYRSTIPTLTNTSRRHSLSYVTSVVITGAFISCPEGLGHLICATDG